MVDDDVIRDLLRQSVQGLELEPTMVLADALLETDRPDLGEDLALILAGRLPFPREQRGQAFVALYGRSLSREGALKVVFRRIHRHFAWSSYDVEEGRRVLRELKEIEANWDDDSHQEHNVEIRRAIDWLREDSEIAEPSDRTLYERASWLIDGTFGRGAQILAEEIVDEPPSRGRAVLPGHREAQLFKLILAFDDLLPPSATNRVWDVLPMRAKRVVTATLRQVLVENGGGIHVPKPRAAPSVRRESKRR